MLNIIQLKHSDPSRTPVFQTSRTAIAGETHRNYERLQVVIGFI